MIDGFDACQPFFFFKTKTRQRCAKSLCRGPEVIKKGKVEALTSQLNGIDKTNSSKFTHEPEENCQMSFLDTLIRPRGMMGPSNFWSAGKPHTQISTCPFNRIIRFGTTWL